MKSVPNSKKTHSENFVDAKVIYAPFKEGVKDAKIPLDKIENFQMELAGIDLVGHDEKYPVSRYTGFVVEAQSRNLKAYLQAGETEWRTYKDEGLVSAHFVLFFQFNTN